MILRNKIINFSRFLKLDIAVKPVSDSGEILLGHDLSRRNVKLKMNSVKCFTEPVSRRSRSATRTFFFNS